MKLEFESLRSFLDAYAKNGVGGVLPVPVVAEHLDRSPAAVTAMIDAGHLGEIKIGKNRFVDIKSLVALEDAYNKQVEVVTNYLIKRAQNGVSAIFYEPVMTQVGMKSSVPADRTKIGRILGEISERTHRDHGFLLSVLVHRKGAGKTNPGPGFFDLADYLGYKYATKGDLVDRETAKVLQHYKERAS